MVQFNFDKKEVSYKIVYYGPSHSGKTTTLQYIDQELHSEEKKLSSIVVGKENDRFFDFLPIQAGRLYHLSTQFQLFAVPGKPDYQAVRKLILQDADGIIFVCDSQNIEANSEAIKDLEENLSDQGQNLSDIPMVVQWNKRDLSTALMLKQLQETFQNLNLPEITTVATSGEGVFLALETLVNKVIDEYLELYPKELHPLFKNQKERVSFGRGKTPVLPEASEALEEDKTEFKQTGTQKFIKPDTRRIAEHENLAIDETQLKAPAGEVVLLRLIGRIGAKSAQKLKQQVQENYLQDNMRLILDLEKVDYIHSTAFGMLIEIANKAKLMNGGIRLINVKEKNRVFFEMMCVEGFLPIAENEDEALESFPVVESKIIDPDPRRAVPMQRTKNLMASLTGTQTIRLSEFSKSKGAAEKIFISYCTEDVELAEKLERDLQKDYEVWRGRSRLTSSGVWSKEVSKPLKDSDIVIFLWTEYAYHSDWVKHEWLTAIALQKKLIPCVNNIKLKLPLPLQNIKKVFLGDYGNGLTLLLHECKNAKAPENPSLLPPHSYVPYSKNSHFEHSGPALVELHHLLLENHLVTITGSSLTQEGVGKTQLALQYLYKFSFAFDSVLWINAANGWKMEFANAARQMELDLAAVAGENLTALSLAALAEYLAKFPDTLIVMDNISDLKCLEQEVVPGFSPLACGCYLLCTSAFKISPEIVSFPVKEFAEEGYRLLLETRENTTSEAAKELCELVNAMPLPISIIVAFLQKTSHSLENYLESVRPDSQESATSYQQTLAAILRKQFSMLQDHYSRLLFEVAGQLPRGKSFSFSTVARLMGVDPHSEQFLNAVEHLASLALIEKLYPDTILLHPEIFPFAHDLNPAERGNNFRKNAAQRMFSCYQSLPVLEREIRKKNLDEVICDLQLAYRWSGEDAQIGDLLDALILEGPAIQNAVYRHCGIVQQVCSRLKGEGKLNGLLDRLVINISSGSHKWPRNTIWLKRINLCKRKDKEHKDSLNTASFLSTGLKLVTGTYSVLSMWSAESGEREKIMVANFAGSRCIRYSPEGKRLLVNNFGNLELWNMQTHEKVWGINAHSDEILAIAFSSNGKTIVSGAKNGEIKLWNSSKGKLLQTLTTNRPVRCLCFSPKYNKFVSGSDDGTLILWEATSGKRLVHYKEHFKAVSALSLSSDDNYVLSGGEDGLIKLWECASGKEIFTFSQHVGKIADLAISFNGAYFASAQGKTLNLWALEKRKLLQTFTAAKDIIHCKFSPNGKEIWACDRQASPEIYKFQIVEIRA